MLLDHNDELLAEFRKSAGDGVQFQFPEWWAKQVRDASRIYGRVSFSCLTKHEQHRVVLDYVRFGESAIAP